MAISGDLDPVYAMAFKQALDRGVEAMAYDCILTCRGITLGRPLPVAV